METDISRTAPDLQSAHVETTEEQRTPAGWRRLAVWVAEHELWFIGVAAPPLLFPERLPKPALLIALAIVVLVWPIRWMARGHITRRTPFDVPISALVLMLPASLYASADFSVSLPKLTGILLGVAVFYAVVNSITTWSEVEWFVGLLILSAVGVAGVSLVSTGWKSPRIPYVSDLYQLLPTYAPGLTRTGLFNANQVGGTLILFIPLNLSLLFVTVLHARGYFQIRDSVSGVAARVLRHPYILTASLLVTLLLMSAVLFLTQSRSSFVGLGVALLFLLSIRKRWTMIVFIILVVAALLGMWWVGPTQIGQLLLDVTNGESSVGTLSFASRQEVWNRAVYMLQDFPYTGVGLGMFDEVAHVLYPFFLIGPDAVVVHAHSVYLQVGVDLGIPGLVAYVGLIIASLAVAWHVTRRESAVDVRAIALGLLGGIVAYHVYGLTDAMTLGAKPGVALWAMLGLVAVLKDRKWKGENGR